MILCQYLLIKFILFDNILCASVIGEDASDKDIEHAHAKGRCD